MELRHLRDFVAVAEAGTFTRAATRLHVTQPSLTRQIKNLEEELGVPLLIRGARGVSLTPQGETFLSSAKRVLSITAESMKAVRHPPKSDRPQLNIGYLSALYCDPLAHSLVDFRRTSPNIGINLFQMTSADQLSALRDGKLDLGYVGPDRDVDPDGPAPGCLLQRECTATHDVLVALARGSPLARRPEIALQDLDTCLLVGLSESTWPGWRTWISAVFSGASCYPHVLHEAEDELAALRLVALGVGVTLLPGHIRLLSPGGVIFRPVNPRLRIRSAVAWNAHNPSAGLQEYLRILRELGKRGRSEPDSVRCAGNLESAGNASKLSVPCD